MSIKLNERNEALYNDWKLYRADKMKMWELVSKYHLSATRIKYLAERMVTEEK